MGELEGECLQNEESSCIFRFQLLKVGLFETDLVSELEGNCIKNWCLGMTVMNFPVTLAFSIFWTVLDPLMV